MRPLTSYNQIIGLSDNSNTSKNQQENVLRNDGEKQLVYHKHPMCISVDIFSFFLFVESFRRYAVHSVCQFSNRHLLQYVSLTKS